MSVEVVNPNNAPITAPQVIQAKPRKESHLVSVLAGTAVGTLAGAGFGYWAHVNEDTFVKQYAEVTQKGKFNPENATEVDQIVEKGKQLFKTEGKAAADSAAFKEVISGVKKANTMKFLKWGAIYSLGAGIVMETIKALSHKKES